MNRLSKKFIICITSILIISSFCSILFNTQFIERFYLYQIKNAISKISDEFTSLLQQNIPPQKAIGQIIAEIENIPSANNDEVNKRIQYAFQEKGIGFQKYWFWEEDYKKILRGKKQIKLYQQEKLNYSLLIDYMKTDSSIYAVTMIVPNVSDAFQIANIFLISVHFFTIIIAIIFIILLVKMITKPLHLFEQFAENMKNNRYIPIEVSTKDELKDVADSLNIMGNQIKQYQDSLKDKTLQMEQLLESVAHDLKTPISLIQLYASGIKDGIDDGTFLDTILEENQQMSNMVNQLLFLSKIENIQSKISQVHLTDMIWELINKYRILAEKKHVEFHSSLESNIKILGNAELLQSLFLNLITNALNYSTGKEICLNLFKEKDKIVFTILNDTDQTITDIEKIWTPYYVGEKSRNKKLSGTGLGLTIIQRICETQNYSVSCSLTENKILFTVIFPR